MKRFVRYVDQTNGNYLPSQYGRCDREVSCSYFYSPYDDHTFADQKVVRIPKRKVKPIFIQRELYKKSLANYRQNNFVRYLHTLFDEEKVNGLIKRYHLGTSTKLKGGCIFYQLDLEGNIRRGKIIVYNPITGRRGRIHSVHSLLGIEKRFYPEWRFFGEHLLIDKRKPVAIVEAEKTAIIASAYFPEFIWVATGMKATLKIEYAQCLKDRNVTLFPDLGAFDDWEQKADELSRICTVSVSDMLEVNANANDMAKGLDLVDYVIAQTN
ncbi:hypothetical protein CWD77_09040 [Rhodohalobacter barkolensis]|uniref:Toprim domain-containing protein n=2 Tax=Rhodohalobacter barkolensis TaxID=2053187 RepID=A0A2N0VHM5_9BACT|nr:hypothetical protein CWD77_09040 [Rhodohalobacter barkolensis]